MNKVQAIVSVARDITIIVFLVVLGYFASVAVSSIKAAGTAVGYTSRKVDKVVGDYQASLQTEKNKKAIEAGIALAASAQGTIRLFNTTTLPKLNDSIDELTGTIATAKQGIWASNRIIEDIGPRVSETFINVNGLLVSSNNSITSLAELLETTKEKTNLTLDQINGIIASPEWLEAIRNTNKAIKDTDELVLELKEAGSSAPGIMKRLEEIATTSSKYRKAVLLSQIISAIGRAFF